MKRRDAPETPRELSFEARLERIADDMEYFAFTVPAKISRALKTRGPVPVSVRLNEAVTFLVSLAPIGGGRHWLRVNAKAWKAAKIKEGDLVRVQITVRDRAKEATLPSDVAKALRAASMTDEFNAIPLGQRTFLLRQIAAAAKPETRAKRIRAAMEIARKRKKSVAVRS
jgi:hypothetical protein